MSILDFWKTNPNYWIPITEKDKAIADKAIYDTYYSYDMSVETLFGKVIFLDQFQRHFQRYLGTIDENIIREKRLEARELVKENVELLIEAGEIELVFSLMPFKHLENWDFIFDTIYYKWKHTKIRPINDFPILNKFHNDTYKKAYNYDRIYPDIKTRLSNEADYNSSEICEYYPESYINGGFNNCGIPEKLREKLEKIEAKNPIVSLSGGVDSMVMLALLKFMGRDPIAVHIIYGNRLVSQQEFHFINRYCYRLNVPLFYYHIQYLRRGSVDRDFYETMTRDIRFTVYRAVGGINPVVLTGHIKDDVIENIWTNIAKCQHLDNLKKMSYSEKQNGVIIVRPLLEIDKSLIYETSHKIGIPYLKNTTPAWSNRGKFRDRFYKETHAQFGSCVDQKLITVSETLEKQTKILERIIYKPIYSSYDGSRICITPAILAELDKGGWTIIFEHISHNLLGRSKPSTHAIAEFLSRLELAKKKGLKQSKIQLKRDFQIVLETVDNEWFINFV